MNDGDDSFESALRQAIRTGSATEEINVAALVRKGATRGRALQKRRLTSIAFVALAITLGLGLVFIVMRP